MHASSSGEPQVGSRFLWEIGEWSYVDPLEGQAQRQDPSDHTAAGADMMAAFRYGIMSWLKAAKFTKLSTGTQTDHDHGLERVKERLGSHYDHAGDAQSERHREQFKRTGRVDPVHYWGFR